MERSRLRSALLLCVFVSACSPVAVEQEDAGVSLRDAGVRHDAGISDAGSVVDAGRVSDGGCLDMLPEDRRADSVWVKGRAGSLGELEYVISGLSAGGNDQNNVQRFTRGDYSSSGFPGGVIHNSLWLWTQGRVDVGNTYVGNNFSRYDASVPYIEYALPPVVLCPPGEGRGRFHFTEYISNYPEPRRIDGWFEFQCPDAGIDVRGCFHYTN